MPASAKVWEEETWDLSLELLNYFQPHSEQEKLLKSSVLRVFIKKAADGGKRCACAPTSRQRISNSFLQEEGETGQRKRLGSRTELKRRGRFLEQSKRIFRERDGFVSPLN